jgi:tetraacyldisaccharide 4'-kinase
VVRSLLVPASGLYRLGSAARHAAYDAGLVSSHALPLPSVGIGNLAVGGTGKTPLTGWVATALARRGARPAVVLRGYGGDEVAEHRAALPWAIVEAGADRRAASARARDAGASVLVLDDCLQHRRVRVDLMLAMVAAETWGGPRWPLPAGPWREGRAALRRAHAVVVTRKAAAPGRAADVAAELAPWVQAGVAAVAELQPADLEPLTGGPSVPLATLAGRPVLAVSGIGDPAAFAAQLRQAGAEVRSLAYGDHHPYGAADVRRIVAEAGPIAVVTTAKDAVKLRPLWPADGPPCLVARLRVQITVGAEAIGGLLDGVATAAHANH